MRRISSSLPRFSHDRHDPYVNKEKLGSGLGCLPRLPVVRRIRTGWSRRSRKSKLFLFFLFIVLASVYIFYNSREVPLPRLRPIPLGFGVTDHLSVPVALVYKWRRSASLGGGEKFVIILGANVEGGVMEWKGAREWAIERNSIRNKKRYVARWGYDLEIVDMRTRKRYAHEWRESWEKVDHIRKTLRKYPKAEWYELHLPLFLNRTLYHCEGRAVWD